MPMVRLVHERRVIECAQGSNLYDLLSIEGLIDAPCGGAGLCGKCKMDVDGEVYLSCLYEVEHDIAVKTNPPGDMGEIVSSGMSVRVVPDDVPDGALGVCVDLGTTTVVAALIDLHTGEQLAVLSKLNAQKAYGQDVITRIHFTIENPPGLHALQSLIVGDIDEMVAGLCAESGMAVERIESLVVCGNTTMIHLLAGVDPKSIAQAPFKPRISGPYVTSGEDLGLEHVPAATVFCLPAIAAFVGGDITAGMLACDLSSVDGCVLFMDIGTNGEIVLADGDRLTCCSCAAGPALEGMNISCGMRASAGAIEDVHIVDGQVVFSTIGGEQPRGICGSGIVSAMAAIAVNGVVGSTGRLQRKNPFVVEMGGKLTFPICEERGIRVSQGDVRQIQLAKGAVLSGVTALLQHANIEPEEVERVIVAGQFGAHVSPESLVGADFLPHCWMDRIEYVGNTSLSGGIMCLLSAAVRERSTQFAEAADYIELSTLAGYDDLFMTCLSFEKGDAWTHPICEG